MSTEKEMIAAKKIIDDIYAIREQIYEKIKDMSFEEQAEYFENSAAAVEAELGVKFKRPESCRKPALAEY